MHPIQIRRMQRGPGTTSDSSVHTTLIRSPVRPILVVAARIGHALLSLTTGVYCTVCSVPFAYQQFIEPRLWVWPARFVEAFPSLYWLCLLLTLLTFRVRAPWRVQFCQGLYAIVAVTAGISVLRSPHLAMITGSAIGLVYASAALMFPLALAVIDRIGAAPDDRPNVAVAPWTAIQIAVETALWITVVYSGTALLTNAENREPLGFRFWLAGFTVSAIAHMSACVIAAAIPLAAVGFLRRWPPLQRISRRLFAIAALTVLFDLHVLRALTLTEPGATGLAFLFACSLSASWISVTTAFRDCARVSPRLSGAKAIALRVAAPCCAAVVAAFGTYVARADWDFTSQGLSVAAAWVGCLALVYYAITSRHAFGLIASVTVGRGTSGFYWAGAVSALVVVAVRLVSAGSVSPTAQLALARYSAVDPSLRLLTRLITAEDTRHNAAFYSFLRANTNISHRAVTPLDIRFAPSFDSLRPRRPNIFLFVVDSLRPDYLAPYNPLIGFTPAIDAFARESVVFTRAFTRYGATAMAVPSIWSGGMTLHMQYVRPYWPMNTLEKLVTAAGYTQMISVDPITARLLKPGTQLVRLDAGRPVAQFSLCTTLDELQQRLRDGVPEPVFAFTLPQDVHISRSLHTVVPSSEHYSGVVAPVASQVHHIDRCFGQFIRFLKDIGQYDNSIVILTSDHGDSLGEDGRWGHAYTMYPEVVRIPLIMHVPPAVGALADADMVAFSSDITPTLYDLLGVTPDYLGSLYGTSLVRLRELRKRSSEQFLLASSYGPVYGMLTAAGRHYYVTNAITGQEVAYDMSDVSRPRMVPITPQLRNENRSAIQGDVSTLRQLYQVDGPCAPGPSC
jgi:hypothetical protein